MARRTIPETDLAFLAWARNFSSHLNESPESFGVSVAAAADFASLLDLFADAMQACYGGDRGPSRTAHKNDLAASLRLSARRLVSIVRGHPEITAAQLAELSIIVRAPHSPRIARPAEAPSVFVNKMVGHTITVQICQKGEGYRRRRLPDTAGVLVYTWVGEHPPRDLNEWTLHTTATRNTVELPFDASVPPGTKVHVCAAWVNPRLQRGPVSDAAVGYIQFGGPMRSPSLLQAAA